MDAYSVLVEEGRLGKGFSLIKLKPPSTFDNTASTAKDQETDASPSPSRRSMIPPLPPVAKALPEWLCSTFSTLAAKHPLRLLLPRRSPSPQDASMLPPPAPIRPEQIILAEPEPEPIFAFSPDQITDAPATDLLETLAVANEGLNTLFSEIPEKLPVSLPSMNRQDPHPLTNESIYPALDFQAFSTPGPGSLVSHLPLTVVSSTFGSRQLNVPDSSVSPAFDNLVFVPFSTPGPGSTLSLASDGAPKVNMPSSKPYALEHLRNINQANSASSALTFKPFSTPGPIALHSLANPAPSSDSPPRDLHLPPYYASTAQAHSDPAPAYYSDDIPEYSYYEDPGPFTDDDSGSEPALNHDPDSVDFIDSIDVSHLPNVFATPGPGYCAPCPIYFDSPAEDPSDPDPLQPEVGYDMDYGSIDFLWEPFNRKGTEERRQAPVNPRAHHEICLNHLNLHEANLESEYDDLQDAATFALTPEQLPSPAPFRFSDFPDPSRDADPQTPPNQQLQRPSQTAPHTPDPGSDPAAPVFAPAPGIYISPLRGDPEPTSLLSPVPPPLDKNKTGAESQQAKQDIRPNSQGSDDSIESWNVE
ncbi:hypothetical protein DXG03_006730 [Asterophora parasitica]|uniref:Uncharacterized protein n=1 Tax=Asterophora parasitica TaxID=117018 RepID=A0A9P7G6X7_9AGAR|nr:hypothetical protein DXG03_006730 [Asterophora parasitica]